MTYPHTRADKSFFPVSAFRPAYYIAQHDKQNRNSGVPPF